MAKKKTPPKKKSAAKKKTPPKKRAAPKKEVNKSKAIRDYMAQKPDAGPTAVAEGLGKKGIEVSAAFVSTIKAMDKAKKAGRRGRVGEVTTADLLQAKKLADQLGGVERAKEAMDALAKLQ